ncbi:MAG TPA: sulfate ABC transporter permease subunit CysW [Thermoanaerobaculia bacterium]|nr:sulfate ABC transporter permease subunit CysW [Thermoanaerobaculia bacterium]
MRILLRALALAFVALFLVVPLAAVFAEALANGPRAYLAALLEPDALAALRLTLLCVALAVPIHVVFGLAAGWAIGKFRFFGRSLLVTLVDLPLAVSPVVAGLVLVLVYGRRGLLGSFLLAHGVPVIFAVPGVVLATVFVTFPFVAREIVPSMEAFGTDDEVAARSLGANGWRTFFRVTLPNIKWGLLYGALLTAARAMGEFGAVSVVSGHIRGETNTLPLHVEILYNEYRFQAAFAVASILSLLAVAALAAKNMLERRSPRRAVDAPELEGERRIA